MTAVTRQIEVYDPHAEPSSQWRDLAPRLKDLNNKVIGFLANGKPNSKPLLQSISRLLSQRYKLAGTVAVDRGGQGGKSWISQQVQTRFGDEDEVIVDLSTRVDAVVNALAD